MSKFLIEKYNPKCLDQLDYNPNVNKLLEKISTTSNFSHLIFYGPEGAGKKTRIKVLLQLMFNESVHKVKTEVKQIKVNSTLVQYSISSSNYHLELTPSDNNYHDKHIIQYVIKEAASTKNQTNAKTINNNEVHKSKIIVIHEADNLSKEAQSSLRRTMEKYSGNCRIIMCCNQISKIISPIRSRCLAIRIPSPSKEKMISILNTIQINENLKINEKQILKIVDNCRGNLRNAINSLQISKL